MVSANKQNKNKQKPGQPGKKDIPLKMTEKKQKKQKKSTESSTRSCCPWFLGSFLLIGLVIGLITYDTQVLNNGIFENSSVGRVLKQTGALPHVVNAVSVSAKYSARGYKWVEANAPVGYEKVKTVLQPYKEFAKDLGITIWNGGKKGYDLSKDFVLQKIPIIAQFIDGYSPGLSTKISDVVGTTFKGMCSIISQAWNQSVDFFKTKVFVGNLSPENIGIFLNSTMQRISKHYSNFHDKIELYAQ